MLVTYSIWALFVIVGLGLAFAGLPKAGGAVLVAVSLVLGIACVPLRWWKI